MIVPMHKYSFLVHHKECDSFIENLMNLGVLHVSNLGDVEDEKADQLTLDIRETTQLLKSFDKRRKKGNTSKSLEKDMPEISVISALERKAEHLLHSKQTLESEIKLMEPWGEFNWKLIHQLEDKTGLEVRFFRHPVNSFEKDWNNCVNLVEVNRRKDYVYFVIFSPDLENLPSVPLAMPKKTLGELKANHTQLTAELQAVEDELNLYAGRYHAKLENLLTQAKDELTLHLTQGGVSRQIEGKVMLLHGWCPETSEDALLHFLHNKKIVYVREETYDEKDTPPVLLKNNRFVKLFEPIGNLFSLPHYTELDMTMLFAPFFLLFFGFCLGDAGYGLVILLAATGLKFKIEKEYHNYLTLMQLFGISTTVIGYFTGTLFGLEMAKEPAFEGFKNMFLNQDQLFTIALYIGFAQIIFGLAVNAFKQVVFRGWPFAFSKIGWILLLLGLGDYYVTELMSIAAIVLMILGTIGIVGFGAPDKGWLKSIGLGLADLYNITGVAGDLLSYIRLFALGVSSAILGLVVNSIALSAKDIPYVGIVLFVLVLVVGHGANLLLASLSAFVHPMRLTFVEFYKNAGFLGGGKPYQPLARQFKEKS